jgi:hypothetical protein
MAAVSAMAGASTSATSTRNPAPLALQALRLRAARHHPPPAAARLHAVLESKSAAARCSPSSRAGLWKSCGWPRAIGNRQYRAIRNRPSCHREPKRA